MEDEGNPWEDKFPSFNGKEKLHKKFFIYISLKEHCLKEWNCFFISAHRFAFERNVLCILCIMHHNALHSYSSCLFSFCSLYKAWQYNAQCYCYYFVNNHVSVNRGAAQSTVKVSASSAMLWTLININKSRKMLHWQGNYSSKRIEHSFAIVTFVWFSFNI